MNMNLIWIEAGTAIFIVAMAGGLAVLCRRVPARRELSALAQQYSIEIAALRDQVVALQSKVEELTAAEDERNASPRAVPPQLAINMNKRSEALRMYKRGGDTDAVRAALGLPGADAVLLRKVQILLNTAVPEAPRPVSYQPLRTAEAGRS